MLCTSLLLFPEVANEVGDVALNDNYDDNDDDDNDDDEGK